MEAPISGNLHIWEGWRAASLQEAVPAAKCVRALRTPTLLESVNQLAAREALWPAAESFLATAADHPFTLPWFLSIEQKRYHKYGRWLPGLLEFARHPGESLLGLGQGLGTDWVQYARYGSSVVVCSPQSEQLNIVRQNFELRGLSARFLHASPVALPLESNSIDVACVSSLPDPIHDTSQLVEELYRVLKPGGKVLALAPARYDIYFWARVLLLSWRWLTHGQAPADEDAARYSRRELRRLFNRFVEHRIHKRQLRKVEIPHLWRWMPRQYLQRLMGRILILKAFKPLSAVATLRAAA